ncbi:dihydrolipoyl dehydrogenase family protein [Prevotella communis]|jgi:dihydrolipoamide dehydrogenase|uniref:dihydrolipoyl dehydrogenase family protein n=1 Tax=Prevotella communis TaxID=2913614 RepID=UPI001EDA4F1D|nr:NAD(P)/FAD-dependent oxidoreductase [Prevotella communis]UKK57373.1 NAD(P)/FAD-dependent oxidoreductase [Prevotella communis]UKK68035.1 NAD(P)/FAD-dependent oxidoreductase [Prevotella communis]
MKECDLIIIGAGPGGYRAAEYAAKQGLKVVIYEGDAVGGTCLNVGCIPTKAYVHSTTFTEARERMPQVVSQLRSGVETILSHPNITLVREKAVFPLDIQAKNVIIATGSETKWLPIKGADTDPRVVDSTGLLNLDTFPKRLAIIGAGVIGMEFASVFNRFGTEVTVIEFLKECLPALDSDIAKRLRKYLERQGITFKMKTAVENIADIDADVVLMATGRKPRVQADFANAGIEYDERTGIKVDENFETTKKGIYAIGDVNGKQMLAHAAEMQAVHAVNHILGKEDAIRFDIMPAAIFTTPEAACVGPTEDILKEKGLAYECRKAFWRANGKALTMNETEGMLKLFSEPGSGRILGCHAYGAHSADIIQEVSSLMCRDTTVAQLRDMVHIHPTLGEILSEACSQ